MFFYFHLVYTNILINDKIINLKEKISSYQETLLFDYDDLCQPISDYIEGYNWFVNVMDAD